MCFKSADDFALLVIQRSGILPSCGSTITYGFTNCILLAKEKESGRKYKFPIAAVIHYHKLRGLNKHKCSLQFWGQRSAMGLNGLKSKDWQGYIPSGGHRGKYICFFQLLEVTHTPWLLAPFYL